MTEYDERLFREAEERYFGREENRAMPSDYSPIYVLTSERGGVIDYDYGKSRAFVIDKWQREWQQWMDEHDETFFILKATIDKEPVAGFHKDSWFELKGITNDER